MPDSVITDYTKEELKVLYDLFSDEKNNNVGDYAFHVVALIEFLEKCLKEGTALRAVLFVLANLERGKNTYWWAIPLKIMIYEKSLEELPLLINVPVYGIAAVWRLGLGR